MAPNNPFYDWLNNYGGTNPLTGAPQNWYDTPTSKIDVGQALPQGEYERYLTRADEGGFNKEAQFARSLYDRTQSGYAAAKLNNPNLFYRDYLASLPEHFLQNQWASQYNQFAAMPGQTRVVPWG
jgi:hypothetical protein